MRSSDRQKQRMRERRAELESKGLCVCCGIEPATEQKYCDSCIAKRKANAKERLKAIRDAVLDRYGRECACCGEKEPGFLTIDHINNDGWKERKPNGRNFTSSEMICRKLVFGPKRDDIQILCYNCNCAKQRLGYCPHRPSHPANRRTRGARTK